MSSPRPGGSSTGVRQTAASGRSLETMASYLQVSRRSDHIFYRSVKPRYMFKDNQSKLIPTETTLDLGHHSSLKKISVTKIVLKVLNLSLKVIFT